MPDDLEQEILKQLAEIRKDQTILLKEVAVVKDKSHSPASCMLAKQVTDLRLSDARRAGVFAVVGFIAIVVVTFISNVVLKTVEK